MTSIITNITTAPIVVPEWALLANDTDGDGAALDITAVSDANGLGVAGDQSRLCHLHRYGHRGWYLHLHRQRRWPPPAPTRPTSRHPRREPDQRNDSNNILIGDDADSTFDGGTGNDTILAGGGNDTIVWNATSTIFGFPFETSQDGRDYVDGGDGVDPST